MSEKYVREENGSYRKSYLEMDLFYFSVLIFSIVLLFVLKLIFDFGGISSAFIVTVMFVFVLITIVYTFFKIKKFVNLVQKYGTIKKVFVLKSFENIIANTLLETMTVNLTKNQPHVYVPNVSVSQDAETFEIKIEKLAGMYEIEKLIDDIDASFRGEYANFNVVTGRVSDDKNFFEFVVENVANNKTFVPDSIEDLVMNSHEIKLQEGLTINLADKPHLMIWGKSGSGKTTLLFSIIAQLFSSGTDLYFLDGKEEFSSFKSFYYYDKIACDIDSSLQILKKLMYLIETRQKIVAEKVEKENKLGLRAYDLNMRPVVLVADEVGSLIAGMDTKQKKEFLSYLVQLVQKGRSVSIFVVMATQSPKAEILGTEIRSQFSTKILLGQSSRDNQRMAFDGDVALNSDVEKFTGYFVCDGVTKQPMKFFVPNLYENKLNDLETMKNLKQIGSWKIQNFQN